MNAALQAADAVGPGDPDPAFYQPSIRLLSVVASKRVSGGPKHRRMRSSVSEDRALHLLSTGGLSDRAMVSYAVGKPVSYSCEEENTMASRMIGKPLRTKRLANGKRKLLGPIKVCVERAVHECNEPEGDCPDPVEVPKDFETDYSSIPWFGRWLIRWSKVDIAGVVHDYLYSRKSEKRYKDVTRSRADEIWCLIARSGKSRKSRANWLQASICWMFLRAVSRIFWRAGPRVRCRRGIKRVSLLLLLGGGAAFGADRAIFPNLPVGWAEILGGVSFRASVWLIAAVVLGFMIVGIDRLIWPPRKP